MAVAKWLPEFGLPHEKPRPEPLPDPRSEPAVAIAPVVADGVVPAVNRALADADDFDNEVIVYHGKDLNGASFKTSDDQPLLNDQWDKRISSINVISGTWYFSTEAQFGGDAMRLSPGAYRDLGPNWDDQISSFMCTQ